MVHCPASHPPRSANKGDTKEMQTSSIPTPGIQGQHTQTTENMTRDLEGFKQTKELTTWINKIRNPTKGEKKRIILSEV